MLNKTLEHKQDYYDKYKYNLGISIALLSIDIIIIFNNNIRERILRQGRRAYNNAEKKLQ